MSEAINKFRYYESLMKTQEYVYKRVELNTLFLGSRRYGYKRRHTFNTVFLGSCRSLVMAILWEVLCQHDNYFKHALPAFTAIGVYSIEPFQKSPGMTTVIENADYFIVEQLRNYSFLNTSEKCEENVFNNFHIKPTCKIIHVPNLELRYFTNDLELSESDKQDIEKVRQTKEANLQRFLLHCIKYGFPRLSNFVRGHINNTRLFMTCNHPTNLLILTFFQELIEKMFGRTLSEQVLSSLRNVKIFDNDHENKTKIHEMDYLLGLPRQIV